MTDAISTRPCDLCGSYDVVTVSLRTRRRNDPLLLPRCPHCGLVRSPDGAFAGASSEAAFQTAEYPADYPPHQATAGAPPSSGRQQLKLALLSAHHGYPATSYALPRPVLGVLADLSDSWLWRVPTWTPGGRLLDAGCGASPYPAAMARLGWQVVALEPAAAALGAPLPDVSYVQGALEHTPFPAGSFDVVTLWHVLEHVASPLRVLEEIRRLLRPGGRLLLEVPNLASKQAKRYGANWLHLDLPRHRHHFTTSSLRDILEAGGFETERLFTLPSAVGLAGSLGRRGRQAPLTVSPTWTKLLTPVALWEAYRNSGGCLGAIATPASWAEPRQ